MNKLLLLTIALPSLVFACAPGDDPGVPTDEHEWVKEARIDFPDALTLHTQVVQRSCAPAGGVCHNNKEFPDLHTVGNFLAIKNKPCNLAEVDPTQIHDGCEPPADSLTIGAFTSEIGVYGPEIYDEFTGDVYRDIELMDPVPTSGALVAADFVRDGSVYVHVPSNITTTAGTKTVRLSEMYYLDYSAYLALYNIQAGDPNGNGILGSELGWAQVVRGAPDKSYLLQRVLGQVPGTRMPLANQPLSNPEYVALVCWIETMDKNAQPEHRINYTDCKYARNPVDHTF